MNTQHTVNGTLNDQQLSDEQERIRCEESRLRYCIQRIGWNCSIDIVHLLTEKKRALTVGEIQSCIDEEHGRVALDRRRFPTTNVSIDYHIDQASDTGILPPATIQEYRMQYFEKLLTWIDAVLPHYYPCPPDSLTDLEATQCKIRSILEHSRMPQLQIDADIREVSASATQTIS